MRTGDLVVQLEYAEYRGSWKMRTGDLVVVRGAICGAGSALPQLTRTHTLMDMRTDLNLIAVPHASLRDPNPEKPGEGDQSSCS